MPATLLGGPQPNPDGNSFFAEISSSPRGFRCASAKGKGGDHQQQPPTATTMSGLFQGKPPYQTIHDPFGGPKPTVSPAGVTNASARSSFGSARSSGSRTAGESARSNPDSWITPPESSRSSRSTYSGTSPHHQSRLGSIPDGDTEKIFLDVKSVFSYARHGHAKVVERCLVNGFDPNGRDSYGNTLFHIAAQNGNKKIAKLAIKYGGDMDAQNMRGNTALHFFFAYNYGDTGEYFISKGANPTLKNIYQLTCRQGLKT